MMAARGIFQRAMRGHDELNTYSPLIFAALMTGHHFSISAW
jgi:hypothetical protein